MPKPKNHKKKSVKPTLRVFCEGEKTEPLYINAFIDSLPSSIFGKPIVEKTNKNTPVQLVEAAIKHKEINETNDIYWVVYDRESEQKYPHSLHLEARQKAKSHDINIAFSNVCFEYWLLLHFNYTTASYNSCDDLLKNSDLKELLRTVGIAKYDKGMAVVFDKLRYKVSDAENHAKQLRKDITSSAGVDKKHVHQLNPYVDIDKLLKSIRDFTNPFNNDVKEIFRQEFTRYYSIDLPDDEWIEYIENESSFSVERLTQRIEKRSLLIILKTIIDDRNHEINKLTESCCNSKWTQIDKEWIMYEKLLKMMEDDLLNKK